MGFFTWIALFTAVAILWSWRQQRPLRPMSPEHALLHGQRVVETLEARKEVRRRVPTSDLLWVAMVVFWPLVIWLVYIR